MASVGSVSPVSPYASFAPEAQKAVQSKTSTHEERVRLPIRPFGDYEHGLFTALIPSVYYHESKYDESKEAGLVMRAAVDIEFKKVVSGDQNVSKNN